MLQKKLTQIILLVFLGISFSLKTTAQITIGASSYTTLKAAFDDINAGVHTGSIAIVVSGNTTETASCILNESGNGSASYSDISITTTGGPWVITGALTAGHLIDLNGADNVTLDGGNNLTISNTGTGASTVIRFNNDATNNMVKNSIILGSTSASFGVVYFGSGSVTGNDNNTLDNCKIGAAGTNLPLNGIYSSNITTGIDNSNNTVVGCNIYDCFNASSAFSAIQLNSGNSAWTLNGNRIYQTASRAVTSAITVSLIWITSGANYTITNNIIGYNTAVGTGTYAMTSTVALRFIGINCALSAGTPTEIQGNTIAAISFTTSSGAATTNGVLCGINITGTGSANIGTTTGNTIGTTTGTNNLVVTSTTTQALIVGVHSSSNGNLDIRNNTMGGFKTAGTTAAIAGAIIGINITGTSTLPLVTIQGNTIGNSTPNNMQAGNLTSPVTTGSSIAVGFSFTNATIGSVNVLNNTVQNLASYGTNTAGYVRGLVTPASTTTTTNYNITGNIFTNFATNSTYASYSNGNLTAQGIMYSAGVNSIIAGNTISNIAAINTGTASTTVAGISIGNATNPTVSGNKIFNLSNAGTATSTTVPCTVSGILLRSATTAVTVYNNMVSLGIGQSTNTAFVGILANHGSTPDPKDNIYYNSIYIGGTASTGAQPSFAFARTDFSTTARTAVVDLKNNILVNERSGGTGKHYAIANNYGAAVSSTGWAANASDNNVLNGNSATIGYWGTDNTFTSWKSLSSCDGNSLSGNAVTFTNASNGDLHLNMGTTPTPIESGGTVIPSISVDIDTDARPGSAVNGGGTMPDIGADEFDGVPADLVGPSIVITTPIVFSCNTSNRTFSATLTDPTGVPTMGTLIPRVYYKKGVAGTWYSAEGVFNSGTAQNNTWDFTIDHSILGGVNSGDFVYYYVVAQDLAGNLSSNPSGVAGTNVNTITTAPNPLNYQIGYASLNGTYQVGAAQASPFNTLTNAIQTFNNACSLGGAVVFELTDATYSTSESFPIVIKKHIDASSINTLIIKPASNNNVTVTGSTNGSGLITCQNSYTTIDGSNNGTNSQNLSLINTSAGTPRVIDFLSNGVASPVIYSAVKNCNITNGSQGSSAIVISDAVSTTGGFFNNITIQNNVIKKAYMGVYSYASTSTGNGSGLIINQNTLNATGTDAIRLVGLYLQGIDGATVSNNTIGNFESVSAESDRGVWLASNTVNSTVSGNNISNLACSNTGAFAPVAINITPTTGGNNTVSKNIISNISTAGTGTATGVSITSGTGFIVDGNKITNIKNPNTGGWGAAGINIAGSTSKILNNFVSDIAAYGYAGLGLADNGNGIVLNGGTGHEVYHNSVLINTSIPSGDPTGTPAAFLVTSSVTTVGAVNLKNNIFVNIQPLGNQKYTIASGAISTVFAAIDNNDYYSAGANLGLITSTPQATIADLQMNFGGNQFSVSENPTFISATDLHLNMGTAPTKLESTGAVIAGITTDLDGDLRPGPMGSVNGGGSAPDLGADEFDGTPTSVKLSLKVFLNHVDTLTGLMDDYVKTVANFPTSDPYAVSGAFNGSYAHVNNPTAATVTPIVLAATGNDAIVDWMFIEIRSGVVGATTVTATKAALIQKDGDIVDTDGVSPLSFSIPAGNYYIRIRHRSHLGFCPNNLIALSPSTTVLDLTNNSVPLYGATPLYAKSSSISVMVASDANSDGSIDAFDTIDWEMENGLFDDYENNADYNMDGSVDAFDSILWELNNGKFEEYQ